MIIFYGDPHGHYRNLFDVVNKYAPAAVVILGDFMLQESLEQTLAPILTKTEVYFIHGNHDTDRDEYYFNLFNGELADRNIHGKVVTIDGLRIAGLGGVFRGKVWHRDENDGKPRWMNREHYKAFQPKQEKLRSKMYQHELPRQHASSIWPDEYEALSQQSADILVTHEAPSCHRHGFEAIDDLAFLMGVNKIFHGHHHEDYDDVITNGSGIVDVHGVALAKCKDEQGSSRNT